MTEIETLVELKYGRPADLNNPYRWAQRLPREFLIAASYYRLHPTAFHRTYFFLNSFYQCKYEDFVKLLIEWEQGQEITRYG